MRSLDEFAGEKLGELERAQLRRAPAVTARSGIWAERDGRRLLSFSCNDYLNLSQHPEIIAAAVEATKRYGIGAGASRLVTGNHPLYAELEGRLARLKGTEAACVFGSGYLANTGIIPALGRARRPDRCSMSCRMPASMPAPSCQRRRDSPLSPRRRRSCRRRCWLRIEPARSAH